MARLQWWPGNCGGGGATLGFRRAGWWASAARRGRLKNAPPGGVPLGYGPESVRIFLKLIPRRKTNERNTKSTPKIPK